MRIGIDCDGVLRDFIPHVIDSIKETHPEHSDKILVPRSWDWEDWLPFWTEDETERYVFQIHHEKLFGTLCPPIKSSISGWPILKEWARKNDHQLILVSAQRDHCKDLTSLWLEKFGFDFDEIHYTHDKWSRDVDVLIDDSPGKLKSFKNKSIVNGSPICFKQTWNESVRQKYMCIDKLTDVVDRLFG